MGIDEVGRGPLAGPVTIGAFLLDITTFEPDKFLRLKVRDSKMLTAVQRQSIQTYFVSEGFEFSTFSSTSTEIDKQGIAVCIYSLITQALSHYHGKFDFCLIDGNYDMSAHINTKSVVQGDQKCFSIAAASIVAKIDRDAQMELFDAQYPKYGFAAHKGYGTHQHLESISRHGPSPIHRLSFKPLSTNLKHQNTGSHR